MSDPIRPTDIAAALNISRPDLEIAFGSTGGNVMCIVAEIADARDLDTEAQITIGLAGDSLGWSDYYGERFGEWDGLLNSEEDFWDWQGDRLLEDGAIIIARIAVMLHQELPPK